MRHLLKRTMISLLLTTTAIMGTSAAMADLNKREHYRCWDNTLRVSHGGWVSYRYMAEDNCKRAAVQYPNNDLWIESEQY